MNFKEVNKAIADIRPKLNEFDFKIEQIEVSENGLVKVKLSGGRAGNSGKSCSMGRRNSPGQKSRSLSREGAKLMIRDKLSNKFSEIKKVEID